MTPLGHYGFTGPGFLGPTGNPAVATPSVGTAIGVAQTSLPHAYQLNDGFHTTQGAPVAYLAVAPRAAPQHSTSLLEVATLDGGAVVCVFIVAGVTVLRGL
jgi:hypothetical protein